MTQGMQQGAHLGDVALVGLGSSTLAAARYLLPLLGTRVDSLTVYAGSVSDARRAEAQQLADAGARVVPDVQELDGHYDLGVMSPGIPQVSAFYASARQHCDELVSEPELAWRESPRDWVGITGTNGKTTTTSLTTALLDVAGIPARAVGNIGLPPVSCVADRRDGEVLVAELSSFQLAGTHRFRPKVGVVLNVTPDHVEWHGTLEEYARAKERMFENMGEGDVAFFGPDETCRCMAARAGERGVACAILGQVPRADDAQGAWLDGQGRLVVRLGGADHVLARFADMHLKGDHNLQNSLAAAACALAMGASDEAVTRGLLAFEPLAHRIQPCGERHGVRFFDDSKGTNVDATEKAVCSFDPGSLVVLLGGHDKQTDLASLAHTVVSHARVAVCYGEAGARFREALLAAGGVPVDAAGDMCSACEGEGCHVICAPHMREAFECACASCREGDAVLLSPACSSFDEFSGYVQRGETFQAWVAQLPSDEGDC